MKKFVTIAILCFMCCFTSGTIFRTVDADESSVVINENILADTATVTPISENTTPNRISSNFEVDYISLNNVIGTEEIVEEIEDIEYEGFDPDVDYSELIVNYMYQGEIEEAKLAVDARNLKIEILELDTPSFTFDELNDLAWIINQEAGSSWLPMEWKMGVGEVVLNRVNSSEFKDTIHDVITSPGQYGLSGVTSGFYFYTCKIHDGCIEAALKLFNGERVFNDPSVVFQSQGVQGSGICRTMHDPIGYYSPTYFCYSSRPSLYNNDTEV